MAAAPSGGGGRRARPRPSSGLRLLTYMPNYRAWKALIAAEYNGVDIELPPFKLHVDNQTPEFLEQKNPLGKVPVLETKDGCLFESHAIARYVARLNPSTNLYGRSFYESGLIDQWLDFCANELEPTRAIWLLPLMGLMQSDDDAKDSAVQDVVKVLRIMDAHLERQTYLVGHHVTLADIVLVCALADLFRMVLGPAFREPFPHVTRWFVMCMNQPEFKGVIGELELKSNDDVVEAPPPRRPQAK